jgi:hypothetical protein
VVTSSSDPRSLGQAFYVLEISIPLLSSLLSLI